MDYFVYSTLATDVIYQAYETGGADIPVATHSVLIKGGAGVANQNIITPLGVMTKITEEQMAICESNNIFQLHRKNKFIVVRESQSEIETVVADMEGRDNSAPLVPEDFTDTDGAKPQAVATKKKNSRK